MLLSWPTDRFQNDGSEERGYKAVLNLKNTFLLRRPVAQVDAAADHLPHPPERLHSRGAQPLEEECRQALRGSWGNCFHFTDLLYIFTIQRIAYNDLIQMRYEASMWLFWIAERAEEIYSKYIDQKKLRLISCVTHVALKSLTPLPNTKCSRCVMIKQWFWIPSNCLFLFYLGVLHLFLYPPWHQPHTSQACMQERDSFNAYILFLKVLTFFNHCNCYFRCYSLPN